MRIFYILFLIGFALAAAALTLPGLVYSAGL
jgi:hypothetical protein